MTDRRRNVLRSCSLVAGPARSPPLVVIADEADAPRARPARAASSSSTRRKPTAAVRGQPAKRSTARSTSCASASTSSASPSRRSSAPATTRSPSRCPTSRTPNARSSRSARPPSCTSTTGSRTSSGRAASPHRADAEVTGGAAGRLGRCACSHYDAVLRAAQCPRAERRATTSHDSGTLLPRRHEDRAGRSPGPRTPRADLLRRPGQNEPPARSEELVAVKPGTVVVQAPQAGSTDLTGEGHRRTLLRAARRRRAARARTSRTRSRASTRAPAATGSRSSRSTSRARAGKTWQDVTREDRPARPGAQLARRRPRTPRASTSRSCSTTDLISRPVHRLPAEPGRHRRPQRLADRGRLHDPVAPRSSRTCSRPARCRSGSS